MLPRFRPRSFGDLIIAISLIRPGPIQGDMVHPYLRRRLGQEKADYYHPSLEPALRETLGVILFQEQVLKVARDLAGFSPGQGELLRRALGAKHAAAAIEKFHDDFIIGALAKGVSQATAEDVFNRLRAFGAYSFAKSHAAAFAVLVYQSAWLKYYHPAAFFTALLNNQPMGFYAPAVVVSEARRLGMTFLTVDVNLSAEKCRIESDAIRMGFNYVKGFGEAQSERVMTARGDMPFIDLKDFCKRTQLARRLIENVIMAGGFDAWDADRRQMIWQLGRINYAPDMLDLDFPDEPIDLTPLTIPEQMIHEFDTLGLSLGVHPLALYRPHLEADGVLSSHDLETIEAKGRIRVAGLVIVHQAPPTAKGFHFLTLEDEFGFLNVIVKPGVYKHYKRFIHSTALMIVEGAAQREETVTNVIAQRFKPITSSF
jgi:error-prone DNA polymerase